jgi:hypothetical protein
MIGRVLERNLWLLQHPLLLTTIAGTQALAHRMFWVLPDYPSQPSRPLIVLTIWGTRNNYLNLWSYFVERRLGFISFLEYFLLIGVLILWLRTAEAFRADVLSVAQNKQRALRTTGRV